MSLKIKSMVETLAAKVKSGRITEECARRLIRNAVNRQLQLEDNADIGRYKSMHRVADRLMDAALDADDDNVFSDVLKSETGASGGHRPNKPRFDLIPYDALDEVAAVFEYGERKHGKDNWKKGLPASAHFSSAIGHMSKFAQGERLDESGHPHIVHAICRIMMLYHSIENGIGDHDMKGEGDE